MQLTRKKSPGPLVGLDIEADSIAAAEVSVNGSVEVRATAIEPLAAGVFREGEIIDPDRLVEALKAAFSRGGLAKRVRLGIGNQRVVVRTVRLPAIEDPKELEAAVRFQAQEQMPMSLEDAVLEHQLVGGVPGEEGSAPQIDVVVVAARRDMIASFLEPVRRAGLQPVGVDLSAFGMLRALASEATGDPAAPRPLNEAVLHCNVGEVANLAVARGRACVFTRISGAGLGPVAEELAAGRGLSLEHANQWLAYVGLDRPPEAIEGDSETVAAARRGLEAGVAALVDELRLSLDYYGSQPGAVPVSKIVLSGAGGTVPGLAARLEAGFGVPLEVGRPAALSGLDEPGAARLTIPFGLALER